MPEYDRFESLVRYISKESGAKTSAQVIGELHDAFVSCMPDLPEDLKYDIAHYFEHIFSQKVENDASLYAKKLNETLYLLEQEYGRVEETFTRDDWEYLKDVVSDFALEIDHQKLTYIMQQITSRGILDG
jgi:hypothetical protein